MSLIIVGDRIKNTKRNSVGIDEFYGPYEADEINGYSALQVAENILVAAHKDVPGQTVGVKQQDGSVKEYWIQPKGTTPEAYELVEKGAGTTNYNDLDNKPTIGDGTNTALPVVGNIKVSANTASGSTARVTVTQGQNADEIEMQFTLPKGDDGADGQDGQDGADGEDAVNPFKGYYPNGVNKPATGAAGDYLYAPPSDPQSTATATIWHYDSTQTPPWTDTSIDVSNIITLEFGSGQSVSATKINDEKGEEVSGPAGVLSAEAGLQIGVKLKGVTAREDKVTQATTTGSYVKGADGTIDTASNTAYIEVDIDNIKNVRFLGAWFTSSSYTSGYAFGHYTNQLDPTTWITDKSSVFDTGASELGTKEYIVEKPEGATHFRTTTAIVDVPALAQNFYCYLQSGESAGESIKVLRQEIYGTPSPWSGFEHKNILINSSGNWGTSNNYEIVIISVNTDDIIDITWEGTTSTLKGRRVIVADYPVVSETVTNVLDVIEAETQTEQIISPITGYLCLWVKYNSKDITPTALSINNVDQYSSLTTGLKNDVETLSSSFSELSSEVEDLSTDVEGLSTDVENIESQLGEPECVYNNVTPVYIETKGMKGSVGSAITFSTTTGYNVMKIAVEAGDTYNVNTYVGFSTSYAYYVKITNENDVILENLFIRMESDSEWRNENVSIPDNAAYLYVMAYGGNNIPIVKRAVIVPVIPLLDAKIGSSSMQSHQDMFSLESDWWMEEKWLEDKYANDENEVVTDFINKVIARAGVGKYQIAVISDTHGSGAYSWRSINDVNRHQSTCYRSIAVFNKLRAICNAALHGGDLSCDYGTTRLRDLQYMYAIVRKIKAYPNLVNEQAKPLFITKGNHDENNNGYVEVADRINLDWVNNTYYVRNFSTFTQVTESTWDGSPLYVASTELVSDKEFRNVVQHWMSPSGAVWGNGAYYFYDIADYKIRFIVANSFPVNDNHVVSEDEEYLWFAQTALNLSSKSNPQEWQVVVLRHTEATSLTELSSCINAFQNGTSWTYGETTVDFGDVNGGGCTFIAHVHGHEHMNCVGNAKGFFDIGENIGCTTLNYLGDATKYGLSVLTIDTVNKIITEDAIDGSTWQYDYTNNKILMNVGDTIKAAKSGLSSPTPTSSDTNVVTCSGMTITAVGSGDAEVTLSPSIVYHVRVLS